MKSIKVICMIFVSAILAACGGGAPSTSPNPPPGTVPASVEVVASSSSIPSAGTEILVTAFVKNASNAAMPKQWVQFSADSGTVLSAPTQTDDSGVAVAKLTAGSDKSNRSITVLVTSGPSPGSITASGRLVLPVIGTKVDVTVAAIVQLGSTGRYEVRAVDSAGNPIVNANVGITSTLNNGISPFPVVTDGSGVGAFHYTATTVGTDTLKVSALGTSAETTVVVSGVDFAVVSPAPGATIAVDTAQPITVRYRNNGIGVSGQTVSFSSTRGTITPSTATTNGAGVASASLTSSTAGPATISVSGGGVGQVSLSVQVIATTPASLILQANPGAVLPNLNGSTDNRSTLEAIVRDASGNSVAGKRVDFAATQDASNGTILPPFKITDSNGRAQVEFIPGGNSTASDGVTLRATVAGTGVVGTTSLTVNGQALFINLGFGNTISNLDETTYSKPFSVYVTDALGNAVPNQQVTLSAIPEQYLKGVLTYQVGQWKYFGEPTVCPNEDLNRNGILDAGEDVNGDGTLTPGNPATVVPGAVTTDATGRAAFALHYAEQQAPWVNLKLSARTSVGGTESRVAINYFLSGLATDFADASVPPAGRLSPYGKSVSCSDPN